MMSNRFIRQAVLVVLALMLSQCAAAGERAVDKRVVVRATVDAVWTSWTTRDGIRSFLAPDANIDPRPGGAFEIFFNPHAPPGLRGADGMRFLAVDPRRMISFEWNAPPSLPAVRQQRTLVIVRFNALDEGRTEVTLHQVGWGAGGEWNDAFAYFDRAWGRVLAKLQQRFETWPPNGEPGLRQMPEAMR